MGFSIGGFLSSIAPAIGGALLGPVGSVIGRGIQVGLSGGSIGNLVGTQRAATPDTGAGSSFGPTSVAIRGLPVPRMPTRPGVPLPIPIPEFDPFGRAKPTSRLGEILDRARKATGGAVSSRKIRDAVRGCGLDTAASMFGLSVEDVCFVFIQRRRRRGGISATDLRRTRSTIRKINNMRKSLKTLRSR